MGSIVYAPWNVLRSYQKEKREVHVMHRLINFRESATVNISILYYKSMFTLLYISTVAHIKACDYTKIKNEHVLVPSLTLKMNTHNDDCIIFFT